MGTAVFKERESNRGLEKIAHILYLSLRLSDGCNMQLTCEKRETNTIFWVEEFNRKYQTKIWTFILI